jgi:hypothetical protein
MHIQMSVPPPTLGTEVATEVAILLTSKWVSNESFRNENEVTLQLVRNGSTTKLAIHAGRVL